jgi:DNA-binding transcriptional MerR regulator
MRLLRTDEIERIERDHAAGISARQVVRLFQERGMRLSEGTFRKYVQVGLLPRSRRVGRKGKHRGSEGLYPPAVVRRINAIKSMMESGATLEDIRDSFLVVRGDIDAVEQQLGGVVERLTRALAVRAIAAPEQARLSAELERLRSEASRLTGKLERLGSRIAAARTAPGEPRRIPEGA